MERQKFIILTLNEEYYAIPIDYIHSIERSQPITRIPNTQDFVRGVINLRGIITPVIDLRERMGFKANPLNDMSRIIITNINDETIGLIVDAADDVIEINYDEVEPPPETISENHRNYMNGVIKHEQRLIVLLSLEHVLEADFV